MIPIPILVPNDTQFLILSAVVKLSPSVSHSVQHRLKKTFGPCHLPALYYSIYLLHWVVRQENRRSLFSSLTSLFSTNSHIQCGQWPSQNLEKSIFSQQCSIYVKDKCIIALHIFTYTDELSTNLIHYLLLIRSRVAEAGASVGKQRLPIPSHILQDFRTDTMAFSGRPADIVSPACRPWGLLPIVHARNTSPGRHP